MKLSAKQCRAARGLLKWNLYDVINQCRVPLKRLEAFEKGNSPLHGPENDALYKLFTQSGVEFLPNGDVRLGGGATRGHGQGDGARITLTVNDIHGVEDSAPAGPKLGLEDLLDEHGQKKNIYKQ